MTVTVQQAAARRTEGALKDLIGAAQSTAPDRLEWEPLECGRTVLNQVAECTLANQKWADILRTRTYGNAPRSLVDTVHSMTTLKDLVGKLRETTANLQAAILALPDEVLDDSIETEWGPYAVWDACFHAYWNMVYHEGQINYIQTLYGDEEEH